MISSRLLTRLKNVMKNTGCKSLEELALLPDLRNCPNLGNKSIRALMDFVGDARKNNEEYDLAQRIHAAYWPKSSNMLVYPSASDLRAARVAIEFLRPEK